MKSVICAIAAIAVAVGLSACAPTQGTVMSVPTETTETAAAFLTTQELYAATMPSVVTLRLGKEQGSGVAVSRDLVITNAHVVRDEKRGTAELMGGKKLPVTVVGVDPEMDIAVVRVEGAQLTPITQCPKGGCGMQVGDTVAALGAPLGLDHTMTVGVVGAVDREPMTRPDAYGDAVRSYVQHDASIGPGSSGGALIDTRGRLVGINTLIASRGGGGDFGLAIPARDAMAAAYTITLGALK